MFISRPHFNIGSAVLVSVLAHYGLIHYSNPVAQHSSPQRSGNFSVHLVVNQTKVKVAENITAPQKIAAPNISNDFSERVLSKTPTILEANSPRYFSPKEVEIQALPVVNVDLSMLTTHKNAAELQQSLPIQLRLYIDEFGQVAKIERIAIVLPQDAEMATQLEAQLKEVKFTPAKREFTDVKSYQDVAFDFKANF